MKKFTILVSLVAMVVLGFASNVIPVETAMKASKNFLSERMGVKNANNLQMTLVYTEYAENGEPVFYRFQVGEKGFMIVSATDLATPVLAYSLESNFKAGTGADFYCNKYQKQISYVKAHPSTAVKTADMWKSYASDNFQLAPRTKGTPCVEPLVTTTWTQEKYYNSYCPVSSSQKWDWDSRVPVGCVALTMSNLMYYYRYPNTGHGAISYIPKEYDDETGELLYTYPTESCNFGAQYYNYDAMTNDLSEYDGELAKMIHQLGVSVRMGYGADGSGTQSAYAIDALQTYFDYNSNAQHKAITDVVTSSSLAHEWVELATNELDGHRPIFFSGRNAQDGGHAWIVDGYTTITTPTSDSTSTSATYFHVNWGWAGYCNGYYLITNQNTATGNFNVEGSETMMVGLCPLDTLNMKPVTGDSRITASMGTISDGAGNLKYQPNTTRSWVLACPGATAYNLKFAKLKVKAGDKVTIYNGGTTGSPVYQEFSGDYLMAACEDYAQGISGQVHGDYTGQSLPGAFTISKDSVLVVFTSNGDDETDYGFLLEYKVSNYANTFSSCAANSIIDNGTSGVLTDKANNAIADGNYKTSQVCNWQLRLPGTYNYTFDFEKFDLKAGDFVEIYSFANQNSAWLFHRFDIDNMPDGPVTLSASRAYVRFVSDNWQTGEGFVLNYSQATGINDNSGIEEINIYPNPASNNVNVAITSEEAQSINAVVYDMAGKMVYADQFNHMGGEQVFSFPVNNLSKGIYFLNLQTKGGKMIQKLVVE